jgi:hypothetical protein
MLLSTLRATGLLPDDVSVVHGDATLRAQPDYDEGVWLEPLPIADTQRVNDHVDHGGYFASVHDDDSGLVFHMVQGHYGQPYLNPGPLDEFEVHDLGAERSVYGHGTRLLVLRPHARADFAAFRRTFRYFVIVLQHTADLATLFGTRPAPDPMFYDVALDHRYVLTGGVPYGRDHYEVLRDALVHRHGCIAQETFDFLWVRYNPGYVTACVVVFVARLRRRVWDRRRFAPGGEAFLECVREWADMAP